MRDRRSHAHANQRARIVHLTSLRASSSVCVCVSAQNTPPKEVCVPLDRRPHTRALYSYPHPSVVSCRLCAAETRTILWRPASERVCVQSPINSRRSAVKLCVSVVQTYQQYIVCPATGCGNTHSVLCFICVLACSRVRFQIATHILAFLRSSTRRARFQCATPSLAFKFINHHRARARVHESM